MRTPRPHDYDPKAKRVIKPETVDVDDISPIKPNSTLQKEAEAQTPVRPVRSDIDNKPTIEPQPIKKREMKRHAFEIYRDQLDSLKQMKLKSMMEGDPKSMSEMVRKALDDYIQETSPA